MFKLTRLDTPIRILRKTSGVDNKGHPTTTWKEIIDADILCEWHNRHGSELYQAAANQAVDAAYIRMWFMSGIDATCRIVKVAEGFTVIDGKKVFNSVFDITGIDNVQNRNQYLQIEVKRYTGG